MYVEDHYSRFPTPEKILGLETSSEVGFFVEQKLFGETLNLARITTESALLIMDPGNYANLKGHETLKDRLKPLTTSKNVGNGFRSIGEDDDDIYSRYFTDRLNLKPTSNFDDQSKDPDKNL